MLAHVGIGHPLCGGEKGSQNHHEEQQRSRITKHLCLSAGNEIYKAEATNLILD
jgi:hypothetical protein